MLKLGMKPVTGVSRVTIKRTKNVSFLWFLSSYMFIVLYDLSQFTKILVGFRYYFSSQNQMFLRAQILRHMSYLGRLR